MPSGNQVADLPMQGGHPFFPETVSSIYFDTWGWKSLSEKINSDYLKTKIRFRWYSDIAYQLHYAPSFAEAKFRIGTKRKKIRIQTPSFFICTQFSLPLSLGLLGALSIVRFRTPIKEPEEIGFLMVVIASAICCATFNLVFLGIVIGLTYLCLLFHNKGPRFIKKRLNDGLILVTIPTHEF
jgi:hypothetical protein